MFKTTKYHLIVATVFSFILLSPFPVRSAITYSKTWTQSNGSKLKISVSPDSTNLQVERIYTFKMSLEALALGSDQEGFYSIAARLRFVNSEYTLESNLKTDLGKLADIGSQKQTLLQLDIPSAAEFPLDLGESTKGQLQYILYYSEQPKDWDKSEMAPNQWPHENDKIIGWDTISQGKVINPFDVPSIVILAIISGSLISSVIIFGDVFRKRSTK